MHELIPLRYHGRSILCFSAPRTCRASRHAGGDPRAILGRLRRHPLAACQPSLGDHPDHCWVGTLRKPEEKALHFHRVHSGNLFADSGCRRSDADETVPKYRIQYLEAGDARMQMLTQWGHVLVGTVLSRNRFSQAFKPGQPV